MGKKNIAWKASGPEIVSNNILCAGIGETEGEVIEPERTVEFLNQLCHTRANKANTETHGLFSGRYSRAHVLSSSMSS